MNPFRKEAILCRMDDKRWGDALFHLLQQRRIFKVSFVTLKHMDHIFIIVDTVTGAGYRGPYSYFIHDFASKELFRVHSCFPPLLEVGRLFGGQSKRSTIYLQVECIVEGVHFCTIGQYIYGLKMSQLILPWGLVEYLLAGLRFFSL